MKQQAKGRPTATTAQGAQRLVAVTRVSAMPGIAESDLSRLITLLATGLERWLAKQSVPSEVVDFMPRESVTTSHHDDDDDDAIEEEQWR